MSVHRSPAVVLLAALLFACGSDRNQADLAEALDAARPYTTQFARFETWAHRASSVIDPAIKSRAFAETLFAPIRNDRSLLATWLRMETNPVRELSLPPETDAPDTQAWTRVREPTLGWIRVAAFERCPVKTPRGWRDADLPCVIISRDAGHAAQSRLTMAFTVTRDPTSTTGRRR